MTPIVDGLQRDYAPALVVQPVNATEGDGPAIMKAYRVPGHPTVLVFNAAGQETKRLIGPQPRQTLEEAVQQVLQ
jgi:thiol:disulfide interchange protein